MKFKQPIVHTLYASHKPSPLSLCLGWSNKRIQAIMYGTEFCKLSPYFTNFLSRILIYRVIFEKNITIQKQNFTLHSNNCFIYKSQLNLSITEFFIRRKFAYFQDTKITSKYKKPKLFRNINNSVCKNSVGLVSNF